MALRDLVCDEANRLDHHKVWSNIAFAAMTAAFLKTMWLAQPSEASSLLFLTYGATVGGSAAAMKFLTLKWGGKKENGNGSSGS